MKRKSPCPECGTEEHYLHTRKKTNRFGMVGTVVKKVECSECGKITKVT